MPETEIRRRQRRAPWKIRRHIAVRGVSKIHRKSDKTFSTPGNLTGRVSEIVLPGVAMRKPEKRPACHFRGMRLVPDSVPGRIPRQSKRDGPFQRSRELPLSGERRDAACSSGLAADSPRLLRRRAAGTACGRDGCSQIFLACARMAGAALALAVMGSRFPARTEGGLHAPV